MESEFARKREAIERYFIYDQLVVLCLSQQLLVVGLRQDGDGAVPEPIEHVPEVLPVPVHEHHPLPLDTMAETIETIR